MIFPGHPSKEPLLIQTVDRKKAPLKFALTFVVFFCAGAIIFYNDGQKEFLNMAVFGAAIFTVVFFMLQFQALLNPYYFKVYEEGLDVRGLGLCPWRLVVDCKSSAQWRTITSIWEVKLSCEENQALADITKLSGARDIIFLEVENVVRISYEASWMLSKISFDNFNNLIKLCIQSSQRNNGLLKVASKTDQRFELVAE